MSITKLQEFIKTAKDLLSSYKFSNIQLTDKSLIQFQGEELKKGLSVNLLIDSKASPLPDGDYKTLDGISFTIDKGVISKLEGKSNTPTSTPTLQAQSTQKFSFADPGYQKDKKERYPIDTVEHIRAAWNYINKKEDASQYSSEDLAKVKDAIIKSWKEKIDPKGPPSAQENSIDTSGLTPDTEPAPQKTSGSMDTDTTDTSDSDDSDSPVTLQVLTSALAPLIASIKNIEDQMCGEYAKHTEISEKMSKELKDTREALNNVTEVVEVLASQPDGKAIEPKKNQFGKNPFAKEEVDFKDTMTYKVFHLNDKK